MAYNRGPFSHVNAEGLAKRSYPTEREATIEVARLQADKGKRFDWYRCSLAPEHWHLTRLRSEK